MECQEFRKCMPGFVSQSLKYKKTAECLEHVKGCEACRDELEIYFIVELGIKDDAVLDGPFVLCDIVDECFNKAQKIITKGRRRQRSFEIIRIIFYLAVFFGILAFVTYIL